MVAVEEFESVSVSLTRRRNIRLAFVALEEEHLGVHCLSTNEQRFLDRLKFPKRRKEWVSGRLAAKAAALKLLQRDLDPERLEILPSITGEPVLRVSGAPPDAEPVRVTISHSGEIAGAAAFRTSEAGAVGLDIERIGPVDPALHHLAFTPGEISHLQMTADDGELGRLVLRLWTAKEAVLKAVGVGLKASLQAVGVTPGDHADSWRARFIAPDGAARMFRVQTAFVGGYVLSLAVSCQSVLQ